MRNRLAPLAVLALVLTTPAGALAGDAPAPAAPAAAAGTGAAALERLRAMAGSWAADSEAAGGTIAIDYRVTGNGSAIVETLFQGTPHEMVTVYYLDGDDLVGTHYCSQANQPHFRLDPAKSTPTDLVLGFDGGTNLDPAKGHIDGVRFTWQDDGGVVADWHHRGPGGKDGGSLNFTMRRK